MNYPNRFISLLLPAFLCLGLTAPAAPPKSPFKEGQHGRSHLVFVGKVPVLHLYGTPAEMGEAAGVLTRDALKKLAPVFAAKYMEMLTLQPGQAKTIDLRAKRILQAVKAAQAGIPPARMQEINAIARGAGIDAGPIIQANLLPEIGPRVKCSTVFIGASRMTDKAPIFGRNLDYPPIADLHKYGLVVVYHESGRIPLASFTFPGFVGVLTGMNKRGLCGATMDVYFRAHKTRPKAIPRFLFYRQLLANHTDVASLCKALPGVDCLSGGNFMVVDAGGGAAALESPGSGWHIRKPAGEMLYATNHFRTTALGGRRKCNRYAFFSSRDKTQKKFSPAYLQGMVRATAQHIINVQALVFRPQSRQVLFAFGKVSAAMGTFHPLAGEQLFRTASPKAKAR